MIGEDFDVMIVDSIRKEGFYDSEDYITLSIISSVLFWHNVGCIPLPFPSNAFFLPPKDH